MKLNATNMKKNFFTQTKIFLIILYVNIDIAIVVWNSY